MSRSEISGLAIFLVLFGVMVFLLTGCGLMREAAPPPPPDILTRLIFPTIASDLLACEPEPRVPDMVETDVELALWTEVVRLAGANCRLHLSSVRDLVAKWPKTPQPTGESP